jgi:hypothetical protein
MISSEIEPATFKILIRNYTEYYGVLIRHNELSDLMFTIRHLFPFSISKFLLTHHVCLSTPFSFFNLRVYVYMEMAVEFRKIGKGVGVGKVEFSRT